MPDGLTHLLSGHLVLFRRSGSGPLALFLLGTIMPDLFIRGGRLFFLWHPHRDWVELYLTPLHTPLALLLLCLAFSQFFQARLRKTALLSLYAGCMLHFFLDFLQRGIEGLGLTKVGMGGYHWFFPLSWYDVQLGIFWPEDAPYALIILIPLSLWLWISRTRERHQRGIRASWEGFHGD